MRRLGQWLAVVVLLVVVGGIAFYEHPLWVEQQRTHFGLFLARVQSNYVMTPEGRVHYYEAEPRFAPGHGIPVVLVHGLADRDESWAPMMKRLKRAGFHVYAPDLLGYGRSPKPEDSDYSISTQEQFVADFIQSLGLQKTDVGGWSMGGWVALKLALDHPEMVDRVAVYDSAGLKPQGVSPAMMFNPSTPEDINRLLATMEPEAKPLPGFVARDAVRRFQAGQEITDKSVAAMGTGKDLLDARLPTLTQPLLIVWGSADQLTPLSAGKAMHGLVPTSELDIVEGCGHLAPLRCSSAVAGATADFFKSNPVPQGGVRTIAPR